MKRYSWATSIDNSKEPGGAIAGPLGLRADTSTRTLPCLGGFVAPHASSNNRPQAKTRVHNSSVLTKGRSRNDRPEGRGWHLAL
jgi:hypothetical protein